MESEVVKPLPSRLKRIAVVAACAAGASVASAQPGGNTFTCTNAKGQHVRSDRPIAECMDREQRVLGRDGSLVRIIQPAPTLQELAAKSARERRLAAEKEERREAERVDQLLLQRYPNEAAHSRAREAALEPTLSSLRQSSLRLRELDAERKPLLDEAEFYKGRALPPKLRHQFDAIDATAAAQRSLIANQEAEVDRVNALYDTELTRLKRLWAGAAPGSLGPMGAQAAQSVAANPAGAQTQKK